MGEWCGMRLGWGAYSAFGCCPVDGRWIVESVVCGYVVVLVSVCVCGCVT